MKTPSGDQPVTLKEVDLDAPCDYTHSYHGFLKAYDGGKMDGFNLEGGSGHCVNKTTGMYQYVNAEQIAPYWDMAMQYVLADEMFQTQGSGSFTAHQDLICGSTIVNPAETKSLVDIPTVSPWGCDSPRGRARRTYDFLVRGCSSTGERRTIPCMKMRDDARSARRAKRLVEVLLAAG